MKKILLSFGGLLGFTIIVFFYHPHSFSPQRLKVCVWSNYFSDAVIREFEKETGIPVELSWITSNEELLAKIKAGAGDFDVVQPSDYMVRQMAALNLLAPLDHSKLPHLPLIEDRFTNLPYDPGLHFSIPFDWGTTGILVNTEVLPHLKDGVSWKDLFDSRVPKQTALLDDMREVFAATFLLLGLDYNPHSADAIHRASQELGDTKNRILVFTLIPDTLSINGELAISQSYSLDGFKVHFQNQKFRYFIPKEGATLWTNNFSVLASSKNQSQALAFLDYLMTPEKAIAIVRQSHLATANREVKRLLSPAETADPNLYPSGEILKKLYLMGDLKDLLPVMDRAWTELRL